MPRRKPVYDPDPDPALVRKHWQRAGEVLEDRKAHQDMTKRLVSEAAGEGINLRWLITLAQEKKKGEDGSKKRSFLEMYRLKIGLN